METKIVIGHTREWYKSGKLTLYNHDGRLVVQGENGVYWASYAYLSKIPASYAFSDDKIGIISVKGDIRKYNGYIHTGGNYYICCDSLNNIRVFNSNHELIFRVTKFSHIYMFKHVLIALYRNQHGGYIKWMSPAIRYSWKYGIVGDIPIDVACGGCENKVAIAFDRSVHFVAHGMCRDVKNVGYRIKKIAYDGEFIALTRADNVISVSDTKIIDTEYIWPVRQKIYSYKKLRPIPKPRKSLKYDNRISLERVIRWKDYLYAVILPGDGMKDPGCIDIIYTCLWLTLIIFGIGSIISAASSLIWCTVINLVLLMVILGASLLHTCRRRYWVKKCDLNPRVNEEIKAETV